MKSNVAALLAVSPESLGAAVGSNGTRLTAIVGLSRTPVLFAYLSVGLLTCGFCIFNGSAVVSANLLLIVLWRVFLFTVQ